MAFSLAVYDAAVRSISELTTFSDLKEVADKADAMRILAKRTHNSALMTEAVNYLVLSQIKMGEMSKALDTSKGGANVNATLPTGGTSKKEALKTAGITKSTAHRFEKLADLSEEKQQAVIVKRISRSLGSALDKGDPFAKQWSGKKDWYTPTEYIALVRGVMGGIDLDPASCAEAQKVVQATDYFSDGGLEKSWHGRVFCNPPYKMPEVAGFVAAVVAHHKGGGEAILLVNNATDTKWWHLAADAATAICFTLGRISFYDETGEKSAPTNGQCFFYFGLHDKKFEASFGTVGKVVCL